LIRHHADIGLAVANVALKLGERAIEVLDHLLRRCGESGRGVFTQSAMFAHQRYGAVPGIEAACAQHQRMRRRINHR